MVGLRVSVQLRLFCLLLHEYARPPVFLRRSLMGLVNARAARRCPAVLTVEFLSSLRCLSR